MGYKVTAGDIDPKSSRFEHTLYRNRPQSTISGRAGRFDFVSCIEGIEHLQDQFQFVRECHRCSGMAAICPINTQHPESGFPAQVPALRLLFSCSAPHQRVQPGSGLRPHQSGHLLQVRYMLHSQGFEITRVATDFYRRSAAGLYFLKPLILYNSWRTMRKETSAAACRQPGDQANHDSPTILLVGR